MKQINNYIDIRQTPEYSHFLKKLGWQTIKLNNCQIYIKKLPLLPFSVAKILRANQIPSIEKLKRLIKQYKILFIKIAPFNPEVLNNTKYHPDNSPLIPTKTIWIDLIKSEDELLKKMKPKTRYNIRLAQRKNLQVKIVPGDKITNQQLEDFYKIWIKTKPYDWLFKPSFNELKYLIEGFGKKCFFVLTYNSQLITHNLIAGVLILQSKNMSFYWHNGSTKEGKKLFTPTLYVWEAIKESKKRGLKIFDFEGIYDERFGNLRQSWQGFSKFKQGFGGQEINLLKPFIVH